MTPSLLLRSSSLRSSLFLRSTTRLYRGQASEGSPTLSAKEQALVSVALPRSQALRAKHIELPPNDADRRKRLLYRAKQRGWLEVDLLLGTFASEQVPLLEGRELDELEAFCNRETIDIYNILTLRVPAETEMEKKVQTWAQTNPLGKADPEKYKQVKTDKNLI